MRHSFHLIYTLMSQQLASRNFYFLLNKKKKTLWRGFCTFIFKRPFCYTDLRGLFKALFSLFMLKGCLSESSGFSFALHEGENITNFHGSFNVSDEGSSSVDELNFNLGDTSSRSYRVDKKIDYRFEKNKMMLFILNFVI